MLRNIRMNRAIRIEHKMRASVSEDFVSGHGQIEIEKGRQDNRWKNATVINNIALHIVAAIIIISPRVTTAPNKIYLQKHELGQKPRKIILQFKRFMGVGRLWSWCLRSDMARNRREE